jgi:hypothetical protein
LIDKHCYNDYVSCKKLYVWPLAGHSIDNEILTHVIQNCKSNRLRRRALKEPDTTLDDLLTMGKALVLFLLPENLHV